MVVGLYEPRWLVIFLGPNRSSKLFCTGMIEILELISLLLLNVYLIKLVTGLNMLGNCCLPVNC